MRGQNSGLRRFRLAGRDTAGGAAVSASDAANPCEGGDDMCQLYLTGAFRLATAPGYPAAG